MRQIATILLIIVFLVALINVYANKDVVHHGEEHDDSEEAHEETQETDHSLDETEQSEKPEIIEGVLDSEAEGWQVLQVVNVENGEEEKTGNGQ